MPPSINKAPNPVVPPHLDPRFASVNKGLTLGAAHFDQLVAAGCYFDPIAADRVVAFFDRYLVHAKGEWAGKPMTLAPWQEYHTRVLFGWKRADGTRVFRTTYIEVPRKNGKSTWIAGIGLYLLSCDREQGAEIYSAAADATQAAIVFDTAKVMVSGHPEMRARCKSFKRAIVVSALGATYKVISADANTKHGFNSHGVLFDEMHTQPNRDLWDVLTTSTGSRRQPLVLAITTAGFDRNSICWEMHEAARRVAEGQPVGELYPIIYAAPQEADWQDPAVWTAANPNLGISIKEKFLFDECEKAKNNPAFENSFRRLYLNQWTSQETRWIPMAAWDKTAGEVDAKALEGRECYAGLDLANSIDLAAMMLTFPEKIETDSGPITIFKNLPFFWIQEENVLERERRDHVPYRLWVKQGLIRTTPGNVIDYNFILRDIAQLMKTYRILEIAYDRYGAQKISTDMQELGLNVVPFGQGTASMSAPCKEMLRLVLSQQYHHAANPVLRWMADNVIVTQNAAGDLKPDKNKSSAKIDGIVAGLMSLDRAVRKEGAVGPSIYNERGLRTL